MGKKSLKFLFVALLCIVLISCKSTGGVTLRELNKINDKIVTNVSLNEDYENYVSSHVDKKNMKVIVDLKKNNKKEQNWFKKNIYNSETIIFK